MEQHEGVSKMVFVEHKKREFTKMKLTTFLIICCLHSLIAGEASCSGHDNENHGHRATFVTASDDFYRHKDNLPDENNSHHISHYSLRVGHHHQNPFDCCEKGSQKSTLLNSLKRKNTKKISVETSTKPLNVSQILTETNNSSDYHSTLSIKRLPLHILNMVFLV